MNLFFCDASALGKRYSPETGTPLVNELWNRVPHDHLVILTQTLGELLSILVRRRNAGSLSDALYQQSTQALRAELVAGAQVRLRVTDDALVYGSLPLIEQYSVNSTDALVLAAALDLAAIVQPVGQSVVLVASDLRLLQAAAAEGLMVLNPETADSAQLDALTQTP